MSQTKTGTPISEKRLLKDVVPVKLQLIEDAGKTGKVVVRGEFGRAGIATENKRVYPKTLWEREFKRLNMPMENRQVFGELDHPSDGRTSLNRVSHIVTNLHLNSEGLVEGEAEVLDTDRGRNLAALFKAGCQVGVSSRGFGSTKTNEMGEEVVQEDYRLVTFDFVADPADPNAVPKVFFEENEHLDERITEEQAKVKEEFAKELVATLLRVKTEAREQARNELMSDPEVAGAKMALDKIMDAVRPFFVTEQAEGIIKSKDDEISKLKVSLAERDSKIEALNSDVTKLMEAAREVTYKLYVEQTLANDPDAELIRKLVGDLKSYDKSEALKAKIEGIRSELSAKRAEREMIERKAREEAAKIEARIKAETDAAKLEAAQAREEASKLQEALQKALEGQKAMALKNYAEQRMANHPAASRIRPIFESTRFDSKEDVDRFLASYVTAPKADADMMESVRARVRKASRGGFENSLEEEAPTVEEKQQTENFAGLGISVSEIQKLSGINRK